MIPTTNIQKDYKDNSSMIRADSGEFCIDGLWVSRNTTKEQMRNFYIDDEAFNGGNYVICEKTKSIDGQKFICCMWFKDDGHIGHIKLTYYPLSLAEEIKKNREKVQEIKKELSEKWLFEKLGMPSRRTKTDTAYNYEWGSIGTSIDIGPKTNYDGGSIIIAFK